MDLGTRRRRRGAGDRGGGCRPAGRGGVCSGPSGGRPSGTSRRPRVGPHTSGLGSRRGGEHTCLDRVPRRIRCHTPPRIRRTYAPRGRTPLLRHRLNWKRASMAGAPGCRSTDPDRGARLRFHLKPGSYDTDGLIEVLEQMKVRYRGERAVLVRDDLSAHWSRAMRAWVAQQDWLPPERLPAYAPEPNPVELLWSSLKKPELANLAGDHLAHVADATEQGIHRINHNPQLPWSFLAHTGLTIHPPHPRNLRKDQQ
ncbi:transposase [Streptomyces sp. NPDC092952]|uniref:transposase n=1 Tax=Streptomyces sp. NPDC092952 TaxID=3366018 RepID=UPI00381C9496